MNLLSIELLKGLLEENQLPSKKEVIGMFGGGFKPPTVGHLEVVKRALDENPELDRMIIIVGSGVRDSISQEESLAIWNFYKKYLSGKVEVIPAPKGKAPIRAVYSYAKDNSDKEIYWFIGAREGNEGDSLDILKRTKSLQSGNYPNVKVKVITTGGTVSGTKARQALLAGNKEGFIQFLPDIPEVDQIWDMLSDVVAEEKTNPLDKYDREELKKGIEVEKEHTDDPKIALKIALDHLDEDPKYYTKLATLGLEERISFKPEFTKDEVEFIEDEADSEMQPDINIDLSSNHFFDRLNDPRNYPDIEPYEVEDFFDKLADKKDEFIEFLKKYKEVVAKDRETNINIPFMKIANRAIAKTIMRKKNFLSSTPILPLQEGRYDQEVLTQSRFIFNLFKSTLGEPYKSEDFEFEGNIEDVYYDLQLEFIPTDFDTLGPIPYIINAAGDEDSIEIVITYNPDNFPENYNKLNAEIKDALRHELEHVAQYNFSKGVTPRDIDDLPIFDYLTTDFEIPAHVQGLYKTAKTKKITLNQAIDDFLEERSEELSAKEEAQIKKIWLDWAKKNLPAAQITEADPKKGTGKKPKGSGRRLYTDEDPSDTVGIKFKTKEDIVDTLNKTSFKNKSHARQSQIINLIHQRVRAAYGKAKDPDVKSRLKRGLDYITNRKEASKEKTQRLKDQKKKANENVALNHNQKSAPYGSGYKKMEEGDTYEKMAAKGKKSGNLKQGTVRKRLNIPKGEKVPMYKIDKEISRLKKMDKDKDKKGVQLGDKNQKYYKALQLAKTLKSTTNLNENFKGELQPYIDSLTDYMGSNGLTLKPHPSVEFIDDDRENAANIFGRTAYYMPSEQKIALYVLDRHPKDILRSYAHELIHHHQNLNGTLENFQTTNTNEDGDLDRIEREAYENGNILFRNWEDSIKNGN